MSKRNEYEGMTCKKGNKVEVFHCACGYYLGTMDEEGPCCQLSSTYAKKEKDIAFLLPDRISEERAFCAGNGGCRLAKQEAENVNGSTIHFVRVTEVTEATYAVCSSSQ